MKADTQPQQKPGLSKRDSTEASDQTAEPDGQFPENPRGTLDDHIQGETMTTTRKNAGTQQGTHQEGRQSPQTGQTNRRAPGDNQKHERAIRQEGDNRETGYGDTGRKSENQGQKTVQGKNQRGPEDKVGQDIGGGNEGSKGQNANRQTSERDSNTQTGKQRRGNS